MMNFLIILAKTIFLNLLKNISPKWDVTLHSHLILWDPRWLNSLTSVSMCPYILDCLRLVAVWCAAFILCVHMQIPFYRPSILWWNHCLVWQPWLFWGNFREIYQCFDSKIMYFFFLRHHHVWLFRCLDLEKTLNYLKKFFLLWN